MEFVEAILTRLRGHFSKVRARKPAPPEAIQHLLLTSPPGDLLDFYRRCDGLAIVIDDFENGRILSLRSLLEARKLCDEQFCPDISRYLPVRADGCGNYDCVIAGSGPAEGAVIFFDHEAPERRELRAGSFAGFLSHWTDWLITKYSPDGRRHPDFVAPKLDHAPWFGKARREHPWPYDERWLPERDKRAAEILVDPESRAWLSGAT
jgi:hypothetical protein